MIDQNEPNHDESDYERAFANERRPELLETKQWFSLESVRLKRAGAVPWRTYRTSQYSVLLTVMSQALFLGALIIVDTILEQHLYAHSHGEDDSHLHETHPTTIATCLMSCCHSLIWIN